MKFDRARNSVKLLLALCVMFGAVGVISNGNGTVLPIYSAELSAHEVVISTEVGGGVVPTDPAERAAREAAGRLNCLLAKRADRVIRVFCGLPMVLKGAL